MYQYNFNLYKAEVELNQVAKQMVLHIQLGLRSTGFTSNTFKHGEHYLKLDTFRLCHVSIYASASKENEVQ
jgi:hypothetical protein